eukprot:COSAG01_NODE_1456_length_10254_cov_12.591630_6_plen_211_part_00
MEELPKAGDFRNVPATNGPISRVRTDTIACRRCREALSYRIPDIRVRNLCCTCGTFRAALEANAAAGTIAAIGGGGTSTFSSNHKVCQALIDPPVVATVVAWIARAAGKILRNSSRRGRVCRAGHASGLELHAPCIHRAGCAAYATEVGRVAWITAAIRCGGHAMAQARGVGRTGRACSRRNGISASCRPRTLRTLCAAFARAPKVPRIA